MDEIISGMNPKNKKQTHIFLDMRDTYESGEKRHPQIVMKELSKKHNFLILNSVPQSLHDGWSFWIESEQLLKLQLPKYFRKNIKWYPIGEA